MRRNSRIRRQVSGDAFGTEPVVAVLGQAPTVVGDVCIRVVATATSTADIKARSGR
jgi:hypothetical protein